MEGILGVAVGSLITGFIAIVLNRQNNESAQRRLEKELDIQIKTIAHQIRAQIELTERLRWQDDFRTTVAHLDSTLAELTMVGGDPTKPLKPEQRHSFSTLFFHSTRLRLMLHPFKASQQEIYDLVNRMLTQVSENKWESATKIRQELLNASGKLLKKEWDEIQDKAVGLLMDQQNLKV